MSGESEAVAEQLHREDAREPWAGRMIHLLTDTVREPLVVLGADERVVDASEAFCQLVGTARKAMHGRPLADCAGERWDLAPLCALVDEMRSGDGRVHDVRLDLGRAGAGQRWMLVNGDTRSAAAWAVLTLTPADAPDISRDDVADYADAAPAMLWTTDAAGACTFLNQSWYHYTGMTEEQSLGFGWLDAVHPEDREATQRVFEHAVEAEASFRLDYRIRRADGVYRWAIDSGQPRRSDDGELIGFIGSVLDIHDRKQTEEALRESETRMRALFSSIDEGYCLCELILDARGQPVDYRFLEVNPLFEQMTGLVDATGKTAYELVPDLEPHWVEMYARVGLGQETLRFVNGSEAMGRWFDVYATPVEPRGRFALVFKDITARHRAEEALRKSEHELLERNQQLEGFFQYAPAGMALFDAAPPYRVLTHNRLYQKFWPEPYRTEGVVGHAVADYAPRAEESGILDIFREVARTHEGRTIIDFPYDGMDRGRTWWNWTLSPVIVDDEVVAFAHMLIETTDGVRARRALEAEIVEREQAEEALRESETRFRETFENAAVGIAHVGLDGLWLRVNERLGAILGYTREELETKTFQEITHPDDLQADLDFVGQVVAGEIDSYSMDKRYVRKDGQYVWVNLTVSLVRTADGEPDYFISAVVDISDKKATEAALRQANWRHRQALEVGGLGTITYDLVNRVVEFDERGQEIFGLQRAVMSQSAAFRMTHPDDRRRVDRAQKRTLSEAYEDTFEETFRVRRPSGEERWVRVSARVFFELDRADGDRRPVRALGVVADVTEQVEAQAALQRMNEILEERVLERTQQVRELASRLTMAEQAERRRVAQILHDDLQQRLYGVQMRMSLVRRATERAGAGHLVPQLTDAVERLNEAVRVTRQLSVDLSPAILKGEGLTHMVKWLRTQMREQHGLDVEVVADQAFSLPDMDMRVLLFQVIRELLFNVVKHAGTDRATVRIEQEAGHLVIHVADDGVGFDVAALSEADVQEGVFGLFSVRERLLLFGGRTDVRSAPGEGTVITLHIPMELTEPT